MGFGAVKLYTPTMRIALLLPVLVVVGCAGPGTPVDAPAQAPVSAQLYCLSRGHERGTYDYESCYRNRPEVQAAAREDRLSTLSIIKAHRSPRTYQGRSYPVD